MDNHYIKPEKIASPTQAGQKKLIMKRTHKEVLRVERVLRVNEVMEMLFLGCVHYDSPECDRVALKRVLDEAKSRQTPICLIGDLFDAMGGKYDPRSSKGEIRPEYCQGNYFDALVADAATFFAPYVHLIWFYSPGNHEESVKYRHETDLTQRLIAALNLQGANVEGMPYQGFILIGLKDSETSSIKKRQVIYYHHGSGGGAPVTAGGIAMYRRHANIDADAIVTAHLHQDLSRTMARTGLDKNGNPYDKETCHVQTGTFKNAGAWEKSKQFSAPSKGGQWVKIKRVSAPHNTFQTVITSERAI